MNVPLIVKPFIDRQTNQQKIEIWQNGHSMWVDAPFLPYFYSQYKLKIVDTLNKVKQQVWEENTNKTLLSTLQLEKLIKYSFKNTKFVSQYREQDSIESGILYTDRIMIDNPDFFTRFPNTNDLKILFFDIEVDTTGMFPVPERNAIIGIGCKCGNDKAIYL